MLMQTVNLDPIDALLINRRYINLINQFPAVPDWRFEKIKVEMDGVDLTQNIQAECYGDVNGSYLPPARVQSSELGVRSDKIINIDINKPFDIPIYYSPQSTDDRPQLGAIGLKFKV